MLKIKDELEKIAQSNQGVLRPHDVVQKAENKDSPLHEFFEWNDGEAAHQYRLKQARGLIRTIVTISPVANQKTIRVWVSLTEDRNEKKGGYRKLQEVIVNPHMKSVMFEDAKREMKHFMAKFAQLEELAGVFSEMKKAI